MKEIIEKMVQAEQEAVRALEESEQQARKIMDEAQAEALRLNEAARQEAQRISKEIADKAHADLEANRRQRVEEVRDQRPAVERFDAGHVQNAVALVAETIRGKGVDTPCSDG